MYNKLKIFVRSIVPKRLLFGYEPYIRYFLYPFYHGSQYKCRVCGRGLRKFIKTEDGDLLCPFCGSLSRTRRLWDLLETYFLKPGISILDFSPARCIYRALKKKTEFSYAGTDLSGDFLSDHQFDITDIRSPDKSFDLVICYHVLEHIENDRKAIQELHRVLKEGGYCIIQTPFREGDTYEDPLLTTGEERLLNFGQADHVRIYSVNGLSERLKCSGFDVEVREFSAVPGNESGYKETEYVLICKKVNIPVTSNHG